VLSLFRETTSSLPDEQILVAALAHAPDRSGMKLATMVTCHCGPLAAGELAGRPLKKFVTPALAGIGSMDYSELNSTKAKSPRCIASALRSFVSAEFA
jgi:hypothetical protein